MNSRILATILIAAGSLLATTAEAAVLRCTDSSGKTLYTDAKCPEGMRALGETPVPQACGTGECDRQRERDAQAARERARAEKEELAALVAARHQQESEDRRLAEARYEAELRSAAVAVPAGTSELVYPAYPIVGYPVRCGRHCLNNVPRRHHPIAGFEVGNSSGNPHHARVTGNEPLRTSRAVAARPGIRADGIASLH